MAAAALAGESRPSSAGVSGRKRQALQELLEQVELAMPNEEAAAAAVAAAAAAAAAVAEVTGTGAGSASAQQQPGMPCSDEQMRSAFVPPRPGALSSQPGASRCSQHGENLAAPSNKENLAAVVSMTTQSSADLLPVQGPEAAAAAAKRQKQQHAPPAAAPLMFPERLALREMHPPNHATESFSVGAPVLTSSEPQRWKVAPAPLLHHDAGVVPGASAGTAATSATAAATAATSSAAAAQKEQQDFDDFLDDLDEEALEMLVSGKASVTTAVRPVVAAPLQRQPQLSVWGSAADAAAGPAAMHPSGMAAAAMPQLQQWQGGGRGSGPVPNPGPAPSEYRHERYPVLAAEPAGQFPPVPQCSAAAPSAPAAPAAPGEADILAGNAIPPSGGMVIDPQASHLPCGREEVHYVVLEVLEEGRDELTLRLMNEFKVREAGAQPWARPADSLHH